MQRARFQAQLSLHTLVSFVALPTLLTCAAAVSAEVQCGPPNWGLDRIDQRLGSLDNCYRYTTTGAGVHIYVIDSGINVDHTEFAGRVTVEEDFASGLPPEAGGGLDCNGHGTAVAGIAAGSTYGVAKGARVHVLRVMGCTKPPDMLANTIDALYWILAHHLKPAVVNISANWQHDFAFETALEEVLGAGVVVVSSAGNAPGPAAEFWKIPRCQGDANECGCDWYYGCSDPFKVVPPNYTNLPPQVAGVISVGATTYYSLAGKWDRRVPNTHWGVDVYAPGWYLKTASIESPTASQFFFQTSAAAPVVTGVVARYLEAHPTATPAQVRSWIRGNATMGTLSHAPPYEAGLVYMAPTE
jgi:subtilisin family serine protease